MTCAPYHGYTCACDWCHWHWHPPRHVLQMDGPDDTSRLHWSLNLKLRTETVSVTWLGIPELVQLPGRVGEWQPAEPTSDGFAGGPSVWQHFKLALRLC